MNNYIQIYKNAIDDEYCDELINKFEIESNKETYDQGPMSFTQVNLNQNKWQGDIERLTSVFSNSLEQYKRDCIISEQMWPKRYAFEEIRLKKYLPNDKDEFKTHVDILRSLSAKRFLVYILYLNDVEEGGETYLRQQNIKVKPKEGRLLMFPPFWTHPHAGLKPIKGTKYIIMSYLHYGDTIGRIKD